MSIRQLSRLFFPSLRIDSREGWETAEFGAREFGSREKRVKIPASKQTRVVTKLAKLGLVFS